MASQSSGPALSHEELAAIDLIIMNAIQRGVKPNEPLSFIESIGTLVGDHQQIQVIPGGQVIPVGIWTAVPIVVDHAALEQMLNDMQGAGGAALGIKGPAVEAVKQTMAAMAKAPSLTLQQLIELRRSAAAAQKSGG
jgi:hypothetical protein